ncbi:hypothetical protein ABZ490_13995 [Streptomyces sp. NPDC005811]|uniref:hypothetical protein n=1 Tax=Streptomyces sp. NPDC005811 TaxID=3154565 RepID=UPI0033CFF0DA
MAIRRTAQGGSAVRWAYGVFLILCVALAVLVHHETSATGASSSMPRAAQAGPMMPGSVHGGHAMPGARQDTGMTPDATAPSISDAVPDNAAMGGCCMPGMQHCSSGSLSSVQLAVPGHGVFEPLTSLRSAVAVSAPRAAVGRAPPDLTVLSQLRI